jgi:hypothetical protein
VYLADGGGGGTSSAPSYSGTQTLKIEPSAIPDALKAFQTAHDRVEAKVKELSALPIHPWAHDEVSNETANQFTQRSTGGGADSAMECLTGYQKQLAAARDSLQDAYNGYMLREGENTALWGKFN